MSDLTFRQVKEVSLTRSKRWHNGDIESWSVSDWAVAMMGEAGEACNAIKKLNRTRDGIANTSENPERLLATKDKAIEKIGEELADTFLYLDLLATRLGINLEQKVKAKFNAVSIRYDFPERL